MELFALIIYVLIGAVAGIASGLLGISGGIITVPCLAFVFYLMGYPQSSLMHSAIGTSLAAMVLSGISSTWSHHRQKGVLWNIVAAMLPGIIIGSLLGAFIAHFLSGVILEILFGSFICLLGLYVWFHKKKEIKDKKLKSSIYTWYGLLIAGIGSLLGIGGGIFIVPLVIYHGYTEKKAIGTSAACALNITFFGALGYFYFGLKQVPMSESLGYIYLPAFILIGLTAMFFAPLGAKLVQKLSGIKLRKIFAGVLIFVGLVMIFF